MSATDGEQFDAVMAAAKTGADWALAALYRELQPPLLRYLRAQESRQAEDLAAETWLGVATSLDRFEGDGGAFRAWIFTIARRRLIDARRRAARRPVDARPVEEAFERPGSADTEAEVIASLGNEEALARIARLPRDQAEVVLLRVLGGLSAEEVGAVIGKRPGTVRVLQHRALRRLARELGAEVVTP